MKALHKYGNATLEELERSNWGEPAYVSYLVTECHRLRRVQLRSLSVENFSILIGQNIGLPFLMPLAIEQLQQNPLAEGDFYAGDLLCAVLRVEPGFWESHADLWGEVRIIRERARELAAAKGKIVIRAIEEASVVFLAVGGHRRNNVFKGRRAKRARP